MLERYIESAKRNKSTSLPLKGLLTLDDLITLDDNQQQQSELKVNDDDDDSNNNNNDNNSSQSTSYPSSNNSSTPSDQPIKIQNSNVQILRDPSTKFWDKNVPNEKTMENNGQINGNTTSSTTQPRRFRNVEPLDEIMVFDTGGGRTPTITERAWHILEYTGIQSHLQPYQGKGDPQKCSMVNGITLAFGPDFIEPVLIIANNATLIEDTAEKESLMTLMDLIKNKVTIDGIIPKQYGGAACGISIGDTHVPFDHDDEKLYI